MATRFSRIYTSWLKAQDMTPTDGALKLGVARSVSYDYAAGIRVPSGTKVPHIAAVLGVKPERLERALDKDRLRVRASQAKAT